MTIRLMQVWSIVNTKKKKEFDKALVSHWTKFRFFNGYRAMIIGYFWVTHTIVGRFIIQKQVYGFEIIVGYNYYICKPVFSLYITLRM